jgi:PAS domain S-box-containing protein
VLYLNELRHQKNTAVKLRLPMTDTLLPAVMAAMGKEGMAEGHDYRGVPVAAYISHIPDSPWFMVAKVDKDEIYAPLKRQARNIWTIIILMIVLLAAVLSVLWQSERRGFYKKQYRLESEKQALIRHYDYLTKYANDIIFLLDENRRIVEVNQKGVDIYGYTHEEMIGMDAERIRVEDQRPQFRAQMEELKARGGLIYEAMHRRKDGSAFPVEISARVIEIEGKKYLQGIVRDISERKRFELEIQQRNEELEAANQELMASEEELKASDEELRSQVEDLERAQLEIKRAKEWSESIVNLAPNIVVGLGENAKILLFNKYAEKITGRRAEEVLGGKWIDLFIPEGKRQELYGVWRDIVENKRVEHYYENPIIGRNNQEFIIAWSNTVLTEDGKFKMVLSMGIDVTERKRGQEKLMESENKYRLVFEAANVGKSITLPGGEVHTNQTFCDMLGYTCEEMNHKKWQDLTPPEDIDQSRQVIDSILRGEKNSARFVKRYLRKNGSVFWGDVSTVARRDAGGKLLHFITTVVDITERKRAEDEIKSAYQNWMVSFNAMSDGISLLDAEQTILQANRALAEMAGKPIDQIIGKKCYTLMHPEGRPDENCPFDRMLKSKKREQMDLELQGRHFNVLTEPIIDVESGRITGAVHVVSDITEQKNAEQRIKAQLAELQRWQQVMLGREDRVMDLKKEINELLAQYGQPPKYGAG